MSTCSWDIDISECCDAPEGVDEDLEARIVATVSAMMSRWSGYAIGLCTETVRPLGQCATCRGRCCGGADGIHLTSASGAPVWEVTSVLVDGTPLAPEDWRYDRQQGMLWAVPPTAWPTRDARYLDDDQPGTFAVEIVTGSEPDAWATSVATTLACELIRDCVGDDCRIPRNATLISSQGVTVQLSDEELQHLLPEVSAWVLAVNPARAVRPARVLSPEVGAGRRGGGRPGGLMLSTRGGGCCG